MLSAILLGTFSGDQFYASIPWLGAACGLMYFATTFGLLRSFPEPTKPDAAKDEGALAHAQRV